MRFKAFHQPPHQFGDHFHGRRVPQLECRGASDRPAQNRGHRERPSAVCCEGPLGGPNHPSMRLRTTRAASWLTGACHLLVMAFEVAQLLFFQRWTAMALHSAGTRSESVGAATGRLQLRERVYCLFGRSEQSSVRCLRSRVRGALSSGLSDLLFLSSFSPSKRRNGMCPERLS